MSDTSHTLNFQPWRPIQALMGRGGRKFIAAMVATLLVLGALAFVIGGATGDAGAHPGTPTCRVVGYEYVYVNGSYLDYWKPIIKCTYPVHEHIETSWVSDTLWSIGQVK